MKRFLQNVLTVFSLLFLLFLFIPQKTSAVCYYIGNTGYATCTGNVNARRCQSGGNYYACCNEAGDVCPELITQPVGPNETPVPINPLNNPDCGGTSQPCCSGRTCDNEDLTCTTTVRGNFCLSQAQTEQSVGGSTTSPATCDIEGGGKGIDTAIGCIPIEDTNSLIGFLLGWGVGVGAGAAFILIIIAAFQIMTSSGNPDRLKAGQELLTSAIMGLILLVFSVFILRVIGVDILKIPGLTR